MPELPDVTIYLECLQRNVAGQTLQVAKTYNPFVLRTVDPPLRSAEGRAVVGFERLGKRIVWRLEGELYLVFHLMIAGRFKWQKPPPPPRGAKIMLAAFGFEPGTVVMTEASSKKRASLHVIQGRDGLAAHQPGGLEPLDCTLEQFAEALRQENHTLKRSLTDPRLFSGIGNAYSDEILRAAGLSPLQWTSRLDDEAIGTLFEATRDTLLHWTDVLRQQFAKKFPGPGDITAFRPDFTVHGKYGEPCAACGTTVQRIRYAENETNYCPKCQTGGKLLADRSMSRLLKADWPKSIDELDADPS